MKKRILMLVTAVIITFSACSTENQKLLNAENYDGLVLESKDYSRTPEKYIDTAPRSERSTISSKPESTTGTTESTAVSETKTAATTTAPSTRRTSETPGTAQTGKVTASQTAAETSGTTSGTASSAASTATSAVTSTATSTSAATNSDNSYNTYTALNYDTVYGVWISYLELGGILMGKSEASFRDSFAQMMKNCKNFGINTVYVHARPFGDALYPSDLFPWSKYAGGNIGVDPGFDPLQIMIDEAHNQNLSFHVWINPLRLSPTPDMIKLTGDYKTGQWYGGEKNGDYVVKTGDNWYLNPAYSEVRSLVTDGAYEILSRYNVDGLQIDDYFYPTTASEFDRAAFNAYGGDSLADFRRDNINKLVKELNKTAKSANGTVLFGISPQGSIDTNYTGLYADVTLWSSSTEYCDYMIPQIYFGFLNSTQPYEDCLSRWIKITQNSKVKLIPGLAAYKIGRDDKWAGTGASEWLNNSDILARQISAAKAKGVSGAAFFSYNYLFGSESNLAAVDAEKSELQKQIN